MELSIDDKNCLSLNLMEQRIFTKAISYPRLHLANLSSMTTLPKQLYMFARHSEADWKILLCA